MAEDRPGRTLAARFRQAHTQQQATREQQEAERARQEEAAKQAAASLLAELTGVARDLGFVQVKATAEALRMTQGERELAVRLAETPGELEAAGSGGELSPFRGRLYREQALGAKWVLTFEHRRKEVRLPLFDAGLEELLVRGLGLERPE